MASRTELNIRRDLVAITEARTAVARAELADAEAHRSSCADLAETAENRAAEAYEGWARSIGSELLGLAFVRAAADQLLAAEAGLVGARKQLTAATREAEARNAEYQSVEARRRAEADHHRRLKRRYTARLEERTQDDVQDLLLSRRLMP